MRLAYPTGGSGQAAVGGQHDVVTLPERTRVREVNVTAEDAILNEGPHLESLLSLLQLRRSTKLKITNQLPFWSTFEWGAASRKQHVHAADMYYESEWFDHVLYRVPGSKKVRHGRAARLVKSVDGHQRDMVIIQKLVPADERAGCVLSRFACQRLRWSISARAAHPLLAAVHVSDVLRLVHAVPDFEDLCDRQGLLMAPTETPKTRRERVMERFFVNRFYP